MDLNEYQDKTIETAIYPSMGGIYGISYCALKLCGESGEVADKIGKAIRDENGCFTPDRKEALKAELGDVLWYVAQLAVQFGFTLEEVAQANIDKLASRKERGVLGGSGDTR
jgi:NTP pyrophosphatase (non-canonical NTP hydrolase)